MTLLDNIDYSNWNPISTGTESDYIYKTYYSTASIVEIPKHKQKTDSETHPKESPKSEILFDPKDLDI